MLNVGIIIGSTRPNRVGESVGRWVFDNASKRDDAHFEVIDLKEYNLPLLDEPAPAAMVHPTAYTKEHTRRWSQKISSMDAFIFVTPEYNHGTSGALKNALDFLYQEWNNKAAGFVAYGSAGGTRAVESLRTTMGELQVATIRTQLAFSLSSDFENYTQFKPAPFHLKLLDSMIDQLLSWGTAMQDVRQGGMHSLPPETKNSSGAAAH